MPFPTDADSVAAEAAADLAAWVRDTRRQVSQRIAAIDASSSADIHNLCIWASNRLGMWSPGGGAFIFAQKAATAGVLTALRLQFPGKWVDDAAVAVSIDAIQTGMAAALTAIVAGVPKDGSGWLQVLSFADQELKPRIIGAGAALNSLRGVLVDLRSVLSG